MHPLVPRACLALAALALVHGALVGLALATRAGPGEPLVVHAPAWREGQAWTYRVERGLGDETRTFRVEERVVARGVDAWRLAVTSVEDGRASTSEMLVRADTLDRLHCGPEEEACESEPLLDYPLVAGETRAWWRGGDVVSGAFTTTRAWGDTATVTHRVDSGHRLVYVVREGDPWFASYEVSRRGDVSERWTLVR